MLALTVVLNHGRKSAENAQEKLKHSLRKASEGFMISGDIFGVKGFKDLELRKNLVKSMSDSDNLKQDWINVGRDIEYSMEDFKKEHNLDYER